jgi:hypothetical protein
VGSQTNGHPLTRYKQHPDKNDKQSLTEPDQAVNKFNSRLYILRTLNGTAKKLELYGSKTKKKTVCYTTDIFVRSDKSLPWKRNLTSARVCSRTYTCNE